jgi:hypothetical protein
MNGWNDYIMKQEQYRDQLREVERQRLIKLVVDDCQEWTFGQVIRNLVSGMAKLSGMIEQRPPRGGVPCGDYGHLVEKAV